MERARELRRELTPSEERLWRALRMNRLGVRVRRQQVIGPFIADFFIPSHRLIIEVDGAVHEIQQERDEQRDAILQAAGYRVLRISADDVELNLPSVLDRIKEAVDS